MKIKLKNEKEYKLLYFHYHSNPSMPDIENNNRYMLGIEIKDYSEIQNILNTVQNDFKDANISETIIQNTEIGDMPFKFKSLSSLRMNMNEGVATIDIILE